ncbi:MAG TPA: hypothetical protein VMU13_01070 [Candidatus Paceibacterota bacterium]|nr:hypothetical protein [Candidatus Paceibacterota bacterium]
MKIIRLFPERKYLQTYEWQRLQAALPNRLGVPFERGFFSSLPEWVERHWLMVLADRSTWNMSETYFVLVAMQDDDDGCGHVPTPAIVGIYASDHYEASPPTIDRLYKNGLAVLRHRAENKARSSGFTFCLLALLASIIAVMWRGLVRPDTPLDSPASYSLTGILIVASILAGAIWWRISRTRYLKKIRGPMTA